MPRRDEGQELVEFLNERTYPERRAHRLDPQAYAAHDCIYFFTICAREHGDVFTCTTLAEGTIAALKWCRAQHGWKLFAYCLMPDHLHFLVQLPERDARILDGGGRGLVPEGILDQISRFKRFTTTQVWRKAGGQGTLWQKSSYDRIIRFGASIEAAAYYTLNNPVRKGLVIDWPDYPYSGIMDPWRPEPDHTETSPDQRESQ